jgi:type II secretory pathway pseudopilin PulG
MKRFARSSAGVTLLEIMLVLAIAANILVMSIRFYQSATASQQSNAALQMIEGITAAADSLKEASGSYALGNISAATISSLMPNKSMTLPWGGTIAIGLITDTSYCVGFSTTPAAVCSLLSSRLAADFHYEITMPTDCSQAGLFTYCYSSLGFAPDNGEEL